MRFHILIMIFLTAVSAHAEEYPSVIGEALGIDGQTMIIDGNLIRLWGISAPDNLQNCNNLNGESYECGAISAFMLEDIINKHKPVSCHPKYVDRYNRFVSVCSLSDGRDIGQYMVRKGQALDWTTSSQGYYLPYQEEAMKAKAGIWQGKFDKPWIWRKLKNKPL